MINTVYIEEAVKEHPRVEKILRRLPSIKNKIYCEHYGEIFNPKSQNFRIQKQSPALILAKKTGKRVLKTPEGFGIGGQQNYYFSHMLNCLYDCRYCFLQGMYPSANYVVFVNYDDFMNEIKTISENNHDSSYFFSGYDCDSLGFDSVTHFIDHFVPFFSTLSNAILELRTKSTNIRSLLKQKSIDNCVVAFSFTPQAISEQTEHKVPKLEKRLLAMQALSQSGWKIGLRLDPLIYCTNFTELYQGLLAQIFKHVNSKNIHSVSIGPMRFPSKMWQKIVSLYPKDILLAHPLEKRNNNFSYSATIEHHLKQSVLAALQQYVDNSLIFECHNL